MGALTLVSDHPKTHFKILSISHLTGDEDSSSQVSQAVTLFCKIYYRLCRVKYGFSITRRILDIDEI